MIDEAFDNGQSIVLYASHYGNWEWITSVTLWFDSKRQSGNVQGQVYHPLENGWWDSFFLKLRQRFGTKCIGWKSILREMISCERESRHLGIGFITDQHTLSNDEGHVLDFLNHPTAFITGAEAIGRKLHCQAAYFDVRKLKRGHYECTLVPLSTDIARFIC